MESLIGKSSSTLFGPPTGHLGVPVPTDREPFAPVPVGIPPLNGTHHNDPQCGLHLLNSSAWLECLEDGPNARHFGP